VSGDGTPAYGTQPMSTPPTGQTPPTPPAPPASQPGQTEPEWKPSRGI
jgi:hypothetical protein